MHLWCGFYVDQPLFDEAQLDGLQSVINAILPEWSTELSVARDEDARDRVVLRRDGRLYDSVRRVAAPRRGLGSAVLTGTYGDLSCYLQHSDRTLPPESNEMVIEVYELSTIESKTTSAWARETFEAMVARLPIRYANAYADEEYYAKNMIDDETGVRAIGAKITYATPGLYWLNFFGRPYVDLIGRERLLSAPGYDVRPVDDGVLIALDRSPDSWQTAAYREREQAVVEHLGQEYFFSRHDPSRKTIAPAFRQRKDEA
jgi:hypothetical protein